jgi:4-diphosphocytidyl-2-C-methyl-D-erythritol kinase
MDSNRSIELKARAKINLSIDILGKREDGYHEVKMIMQTIKLHDRIIIEPLPYGIDVVSNRRYVPSGAGNIAYKAAELITDRCNLKSGVRVKIDKRIPVAAGLGGGSSDAAAVLKGINELFSLGLSNKELMILGKEIGSDVPFCINGGTMLAEGIGEKLTELTGLNNVPIVLVKPNIRISTSWVYKNFTLDKIKERPSTELLIEALDNNNITLLAGNLKNVLETVTAERFRIIKKVKNMMIERGANGSLMSGSGPTVFGIFTDMDKAKSAFGKFRKEKWNCFLTETISEES